MAFRPWILLLLFHCATAMYIPDDTEILVDYNLDEALDIPVEDTYSELSSLNFHAIRDKRHADREPYAVLESTGLRSHFRKDVGDNDDIKSTKLNQARRQRRSPESSDESVDQQPGPLSTSSSDGEVDIAAISSDESDEKVVSAEPLPTAQKQIGYVRPRSSGINKTPSEYGAGRDESDTMLAATSNEGIKSRSPLVNFVTQQQQQQQQRKSVDFYEPSLSPDQKPSEASKAAVYSDRYYVRPRSSSARYQMYDDDYPPRYDG